MNGFLTLLRWESWRLFRASLVPGVPGVAEDVAFIVSLLWLVRAVSPGVVPWALPYLAVVSFFAALSMQLLYHFGQRPGADPLLPLLLCGRTVAQVLAVRIIGLSLRTMVGVAAILPPLAVWGALPSGRWAAAWLALCAASALFGGAVTLAASMLRSRRVRGQWVLGGIVAIVFASSAAVNLVVPGVRELDAISTLHGPLALRRLDPSIATLLAPWCASMVLGTVASVAFASWAIGAMRRGD